MAQKSVNGIRATCAITEPWLVSTSAAALMRATPQPAPWISAEAAMELMDSSPTAAEARARRGLHVNAADPQAKSLLAASLVRLGRWSEARAILEPLSRTQP